MLSNRWRDRASQTGWQQGGLTTYGWADGTFKGRNGGTILARLLKFCESDTQAC